MLCKLHFKARLFYFIFKFRIPIIIGSLGVREMEMMCLKYQAPDGHQETALIIIAVGKKTHQRTPVLRDLAFGLSKVTIHTPHPISPDHEGSTLKNPKEPC